MHEPHDLLRNLALVLAVAAVTTVVFQRLRQPVVFGYMLAGLVIGPHVPIPLVADPGIVRTLSELGVILLMFSLGLEFSPRRLSQVGGRVVVIAALETSLMFWLGYETARLMKWPVIASLFTGAAVAISSTTIIVKAFADQRARGRFTDLVIGILIVEDLIAIVLIAFLTSASSGQGGAPLLALTIVRLVAVLLALMVVGLWIVPRLVRFVARLERNEILLVVAIGICFSTAVLAHSIGYSVALGAFIAGSLISESGEVQRVGRLVEPIRDMFAAIFFVSVGMTIEPAMVKGHWPVMLGLALLVIAGKFGAVSLATFLTGAGTQTAVRSGMSMAQVGEFSFIMAGLGLTIGAVQASFYAIVVVVSAVTTLTTPWLIRFADPAAAWIDRHLPRSLQTFAALYGTWFETLRTGTEGPGDAALLNRALRGLAIDAFVVGAFCIGAAVASDSLSEWIEAYTGIVRFGSRAVVVAGAVLLSLPFMRGIVRTGRVLGQILARRAFPDPEPGTLDRAAAPRRALVVVTQLTTMVVVGAPMVAITQPFLPPVTGVLLLLVIPLAVGIALWRTASDLQGHVKAAAEAIVSAIGRRSAQDDASEAERALQRAYHLVPGLGDPVPVRIDESSPVAGMTLADLGLRGRTGATIIAISRGADVVLVPDGHEVLKPGDVVALAGTREAIEAAKELLA